MKKVIIRMVKPEDAESHVKLCNDVWRIAYKHIFPVEVFDERDEQAKNKILNFSNNHHNDNTKMSYVAEVDGKIVGFVFGRIGSNYEYFNERGYADLEAMYIYPEYQGLKIASRFKDLFVNWAKNNGATKFVIGVLKDNLKARAVYEKWGGVLDSHTQPIVKLGVEYDEVFYTYKL